MGLSYCALGHLHFVETIIWDRHVEILKSLREKGKFST